MKNIVLLTIAMGVLSSTSYADTLGAIYDKYSERDNGHNYYHVIDDSGFIYSDNERPAAGDIHSVTVHNGGDVWNIALRGENGKLLGYLQSNKEDRWDGIFAVMRHTGYVRAFDRIESTLTAVQGSGFTFDDLNVPQWTWSGTSDTSIDHANSDATWTYTGYYSASLSGQITFNTPDGRKVTISDSYTYNNIYDTGDAITAALTTVVDIADQAFEAGWNDGYEVGYQDGYDDGYVDGYNDGWSDAIDHVSAGNPTN